MQELKKLLFDEMFSFLHMALREYEKTVSQNWLADIAGQLKTTCATLVNAVVFGDLLRLTKSLSSICSAWICFCWLTFLSTFQAALQTLELFYFCPLWLSMTYLTTLLFFSISSSVLLIKAAIALSSSSLHYSFVLVVW